MNDRFKPAERRGISVPRGRINRMARLGGLTTSLAGSVAARGGLELLSGRKPRLPDLLLTPANATRIADQLARMRGAAMKAGQLLSMETQDFLPNELSVILARLRAEAHHMPPGQLKKTLMANWGRDFLKRFSRFDVHPIAAASIGQVHRARTSDGRDLAIKVQYPGVRDSIDSDIRNLGTILRASGLLPKGFDIARLLEDARIQLHEETDYFREGEALSRFGRYLEDDDAFVLPRLHEDFVTQDILAMDFVEGIPIEDVAKLDQQTRDRVATRLIALTLRELFEFRDMQTDPNFANYLYAPDTGRIVLLDFGATRRFDTDLVTQYQALLRAAVEADLTAAAGIMIRIGLVPPDLPERDLDHVLQLFDMATEPFRTTGPFDVAGSALLARLRKAGLVLADEQIAIQAPPTDTLLLQRKVLGCYLLAERLRARVDLSALIGPYV